MFMAGAVFVGAVALCSYVLFSRPTPGPIISFEFDATEFRREFPRANARWEPVPREGDQRLDLSDRVKFALRRYPDSMVESNLRKVILVQDLTIDGVTPSGTYMPDARTVILNVHADAVSLEGVWLEQILHHEFSSILLHRYRARFPYKEWILANDPRFEYGAGGYDAIRSGRANISLDSRYSRLGVLCQYGAADFEDDVNTYAQFMLGEPQVFWSFAQDKPRIMAKAKLLEQFYHSISPSFRFPQPGIS